MNVTKHVLKGRQLHNEGCLGMVPAEQGEYPKASNHEFSSQAHGTSSYDFLIRIIGIGWIRYGENRLYT